MTHKLRELFFQGVSFLIGNTNIEMLNKKHKIINKVHNKLF
jgi:hypothetical protein